jgi:hypothetical protein
MNAYRTYLTIEDPKQVILSDVPFAAEQRVEVLVVEADGNRNEAVEELRDLLKATQQLPETQAISEEEIAAEIEAYRSGK